MSVLQTWSTFQPIHISFEFMPVVTYCSYRSSSLQSIHPVIAEGLKNRSNTIDRPESLALVLIFPRLTPCWPWPNLATVENDISI